MSTQQDIYAAGFENHPPMLNKDNFVPCIPHVAKSSYEQTYDELTEKEAKLIKVDDQAIQTILMGLLEDIFAVVDSCQTTKEIWLPVEPMMKEKITNNKFLNNLQPEWNRSVTVVHQTKNLYEVDYTQLYDFLKFNQTENEYNAVQNVGNHVIQNAVQNPRVQNVRNQNGLIVVTGIAPSIAYQNVNQNENGNAVVARAEGNANGNNCNQIRDIDEIEDINANCMLMANLQEASTLSIQIGKALVYDSDGTSENDSYVIPDASSVEQSGGILNQNHATIEEIHAHFESLYNNLATEVERVNMVNRKYKKPMLT
nr:hypothetical protein [Tanacetum cinerariifolium]